MITKPLLAADASDRLEELSWPMIGSPKLDGIRCLRIGDTAVSRKFLPIPNRYIREKVTDHLPEGVDGEIIVPGAGFHEIQSAVMSRDGEPNFEYHIFDWVTEHGTNQPFAYRYAAMAAATWPDFVRVVTQAPINSLDECVGFEAANVEMGYEGIMLRKADGRYKCGRSTFNERILLKVKRWKDIEGTVVGFVEQLTNLNEAVKDHLGHTKRSSAQDGKVFNGTLGKLRVMTKEFGEVVVGTGEGLTNDLRQHIWDNQAKYMGRVVTIKYQPHGTVDLPRIPILRGFRAD